MSLRVHVGFLGYLDDRYVGVGVHDHQRNEDSVVVASLRLALQVNPSRTHYLLHNVPEFRSATSIVPEFVGLRRESPVIIE